MLYALRLVKMMDTLGHLHTYSKCQENLLRKLQGQMDAMFWQALCISMLSFECGRRCDFVRHEKYAVVRAHLFDRLRPIPLRETPQSLQLR
jgi:hypothetical protein